MNDSIAILGRQPALGLAELESLYGSNAITPIGDGSVARISIAPCSIDFARLGGTVKLCKLLSIRDTTNWKDIQQFLVSVSPAQAERMPAGKMHLGLSAYGLGVSPEQLLTMGLTLKKAIRLHSGRTVRLVPNKSAELNTAQVLHNKLTGTNGWELVLVRDRHQTIIAQTVFIQDIESYGRRDHGRPKRDARVGMLPPKLAQIIINLAIGPQEYAAVAPELSGDICLQEEDNQKQRATRTQTTVLDPFCGTGVVLQEALLMGYQAYGTDMEPRMVEYSHTNLDWLAGLRTQPLADYRLAAGDATSYTWQPPVDTVASETYLGRPFTALPTPELLAQTVSECNLIIKKFLQHIYHQLSPATRLCLAVPAWQIRPGEFRHLPLIDRLHDMGYNLVSLQHVRDKDLLYYREDQIVARQLLIITRN
jgi:SAM-dependent methyltransferase